MRVIKYIKFVIAILFVEIILGKICYEYGKYVTPSGIGWWYALIVFAFFSATISFFDAKEDYSFKFNIGTAIYLLVPTVMLIILSCTNNLIGSEIGMLITVFILLGINLALEVITLILKIKED